VDRVAYPGPPWTVPFTLALIVVAVVAAVVGGAFRQRRLIVWTSVVTMAACLVSVVATVVTAGGQVWRFGIQESLGIRIAAILMVAAALDSLRRRRRPPADATPSAAPNGDQAPASA
jgi:type VI protein secretion system component VasK